jgi:hypothetical protein
LNGVLDVNRMCTITYKWIFIWGWW